MRAAFRSRWRTPSSSPTSTRPAAPSAPAMRGSNPPMWRSRTPNGPWWPRTGRPPSEPSSSRWRSASRRRCGPSRRRATRYPFIWSGRIFRLPRSGRPASGPWNRSAAPSPRWTTWSGPCSAGRARSKPAPRSGSISTTWSSRSSRSSSWTARSLRDSRWSSTCRPPGT